jgi:hypothetical protein
LAPVAPKRSLQRKRYNQIYVTCRQQILSSDIDSSQLGPAKKKTAVSPPDSLEESEEEEIPIFMTAPQRHSEINTNVEELNQNEHIDDIIMEEDYPIDDFDQMMEDPHDDIIDSDAWDSIPNPPQAVFVKPLDISPGRQLNPQKPASDTGSVLNTPCRPRQPSRDSEGLDSVRVRISRGQGSESECDISIGNGESGTPKSVRWMRRTISEKLPGVKMVCIYD